MTTQLTEAKQLISALGGDPNLVTEDFLGLLARRLGYTDTVQSDEGEVINPETELYHIKKRLLELSTKWVNEQYNRENPNRVL